MLVEGFDKLNMSITFYNHPYYLTHMERLGLEKDIDWIEYMVYIPDEGIPLFDKLAERVLKTEEYEIVTYADRKVLFADAMDALKLVDAAYSKLYGTVPLTEAVIRHAIKGYFPMVNLNYICSVKDRDGKIVGFGILVPSIAKALKASNGKLFPFGIFRLLKALRGKNELLEMFLIAVNPDLQKQGVPVRIAHSHSSSQDKNLKYLIKLFYMRLIPRYATQLFACGKEAGDWMFRGAPYRVINNAVDTTKYTYSPEIQNQMRKQLGINGDALVIGHVGRFDAVKNHTFLIDCFVHLKKQRDNAVLLLVGDGGLRQEIQEKAKTCGLTDSVIFTGLRSDVPELMQVMDIFVFPSLYEGLGIAAIEAQAAGLPCLVSDGVPEECAKTDRVVHCALKDGPQKWAEQILQMCHTARQDTSEQIAQAGYDLKENALWLQNYYLEQWKKEA
jgi:glycosyltransferase involved in cell wall biosynthesis